jgi:hypothetical protein
MDLGPRADRVSSLIGSLLLIATVITKLLTHGRIWTALFAIAGLGCGLLTAVTRRIQLREAGILGCGYGLLRWENIDGCELSPIGGLSLKLKNKGWMFCSDVPRARHAEVSSLLASKCPAIS